MIAFFANIFGYVLNFLYSILQNYGLAIILFSILIKIILLPITIKQQKTLRKTAKLQGKLKEIQFKYKNDQEKMNNETLALYKQENMSPFSGCFSAIVQIILLLAMFYLVSSPLTYMKKVDAQVIENYTNEIKTEQNNGKNINYPEISIIKEKGSEDEAVYINMEFLGLDLSNVPTANLSNPTVYIIPILYLISSFISVRITNNINNKNNKEKQEENKEKTEMDAMQNVNRNMMLFMPLISVSVSMVAPLGLALYWLVNSILMIIEKLCIDKYLNSKEEKENA